MSYSQQFLRKKKIKMREREKRNKISFCNAKQKTGVVRHSISGFWTFNKDVSEHEQIQLQMEEDAFATNLCIVEC